MKSFSVTSFLAAVLALSGVFAGNLVQLSRASIDSQVEAIGAQCDEGDQSACRKLALVTGGQCAGPAGSGCRYTLEIVKPE